MTTSTDVFIQDYGTQPPPSTGTTTTTPAHAAAERELASTGTDIFGTVILAIAAVIIGVCLLAARLAQR